MAIPYVNQLNWGEFLLLIILVTLLFEFITVVCRFAFGLRAGTSFSFLGTLTGGYRIHHLYVGASLTGVVLITGLSPSLNNALLILGMGLILSDLLHHFVVLWPITGAHEFHMTYRSGS